MPINKVSVGAATGALTALICWGLKQFGAIEVPGEIAVAISTVLSFVASYVTPLEQP